ncbi:gamma-glutamyltransferase [Winogradskyella aurantiaca]|uniref:gamma-glutamyltransferase n=1 Tax=Winogradskyella aurantiaca TaxID=2219558 RepID=UPI000E1C7069|nr:gamma-glutamyltransferase [Winogradskyella aurantiaca]
MRTTILKLFLCTILLTIFNCDSRSKDDFGVIAESAMVVSAREEASKIGVEIMKKGGNAFDAMMATELALAVVHPSAGNIGGGGFLVFRMANGETGALDYREKAPRAAEKDMYLDSLGQIIKGKSTIGAYAIGVPGTIAGIFKAHKRYGKLSVEEVITPVIALAENGFSITEKQQARFNSYDSIFKVVNGKDILFGSQTKAGDVLANPDLAEALKLLISEGADAFYSGTIGEAIVDRVQSNGGIITLEDLMEYDAVWRDPVEFEYDNLKVISMSPPSSGGICLQQLMGMIEPFDLDKYDHNSLKAVQVITEAEKRTYADRNFFLGDPDFIDIPVKEMTSASYLQKRMEDFSFEQATPVNDIAHGAIAGYESEETTHYSIVDPYGNALAVTTTLNGSYGSKLFVDEFGFFLNNQMDDFSSKPGEPNYYGLIGAEANSIEGEKRMLSSMTPTIIEREGEFWMSVGTPGGSTIITSVLQTILNVHEYNMTMQQAVSAPRFHNQWLPDEIRIETTTFSKAMIDSLRAKGYPIDLNRIRDLGRVDGILKLDDGAYEGGADPRGDDTAVGF